RASLPKVERIFGPGNVWVTTAKQLVAQDPGGAVCDLPAGPSEVMVIADESARADFVAADLLAQAEHDPLAQAILITPSAALAVRVQAAITTFLPQLERRAVLAQSLISCRCILVPDPQTAVAVANAYAPEHLLLQVREPRRWLAAWEPGLARLHANELPWRTPGDDSQDGLNRYPEPQPRALIERLAALYRSPTETLLATRGSDEAIDLLTRAFCRAGEDAVVVCPPTFGMYATAARIQGARVVGVPLLSERGFALDAHAVLRACG